MALLREPAVGSLARDARQIDLIGGPRAALERHLGLFADEAEQAASAALDGWERAGVIALSYRDARYPVPLRGLEPRPPLLFARGALSACDGSGVSVIGTRQPTAAGRRTAAAVAEALVGVGAPVISGLAIGIDTAAHRAALAAGGISVAVLGNGVDRVYPPANAELQRRLHGLISPFWPRQAPDRATFPVRNALMSGLTRATVVIEAGDRSGARIQARHALAQGRRLVLMSGVLENDWARHLARHTLARVIEGTADLIAALT